MASWGLSDFQEKALRSALGAGNSLILSTLAAAGGLLVAYWRRYLIVLLFGPAAPGIVA